MRTIRIYKNLIFNISHLRTEVNLRISICWIRVKIYRFDEKTEKGDEGVYKTYAKLRDAKNLSDYAVAKKTGIGATTISNWKTGRSTPKIDKLIKIADVLEVDVTELIDELH